MRPTPALTALLAGLLAATAASAGPVLQMARAEKAPAIDGVFDDPCWQDQPLMSSFRVPDTGAEAATQTFFRAVYDDRGLYFAVLCMEPELDNLVARFTEHDDTLWADDCVEFFIDAANSREGYVQIIVNATGAIYDAWTPNGGLTMDTGFESCAEAAVRKVADGWQVEMAVPYVGLHLPDQVPSTWAVNVCREKKTPPAELSCWSPTMKEGFAHPEAFGSIEGLKANFAANLVRVGAPELKDVYFEGPQLNASVAVPYQNATGAKIPVSAQLVITDPDGNRFSADAATVLTRGSATLTIPIAVEPAALGTLDLEIRRRANKELLSRTKHVVSLDYQPIDIELIQPAYRGAIYASQPSSEIILRCKVNAPKRQLAGASMEVSFCVGSTALSTRRVSRLSAAGDTTVAFSGDLVPAGTYTVRAAALDKKGVVFAEGARDIPKLRPQEHEVILDGNGRLLVDGQPFFPSGFMGAAPDPRLSQAGFNTIHTYVAWYTHRDADLNAWLDEARSLGLKVILEPYPGPVGFYGFRDRSSLTEQDLEDIRAFVNQYKSHPAVLAWYMCDEPRGSEWRANLKRVYEVVSQADPFHPCVALDNHASTLVKLQDCADILWIDPYPGFATGGGPKEPLSMVRQAIEDVRAGLKRNMPVWVAPQAFSYAEWDEAKRVVDREPTLTEIRCMHYMALLSGADGLIPYAWAYAQKHPSTLNTYLSNLGPQTALLTPVLLHGQGLGNARVIGAGAKDVQFKAWQYEGELYAVAVNSAPEERYVKLIVPGLGDGWMKVLSEDRRVQAYSNVIEDRLPPYAARLYTNKARVPSGVSLDTLAARIANDEKAQGVTW